MQVITFLLIVAVSVDHCRADSGHPAPSATTTATKSAPLDFGYHKYKVNEVLAKNQVSLLFEPYRSY
jgi:hypothetical protein